MKNIVMNLILDFFEKILAQDESFYVNTGTVAVPVWTEIKGVLSYSLEASKTMADTTTYDSAGIKENIPNEVSYKLTLDMLYDTALATPEGAPTTGGVRDAGQLKLETLGNTVGRAGIGQFKIDNGELVELEFSGCVSYSEGGRNEAATFQATINVTGAINRTVLAP